MRYVAFKRAKQMMKTKKYLRLVASHSWKESEHYSLANRSAEWETNRCDATLRYWPWCSTKIITLLSVCWWKQYCVLLFLLLLLLTGVFMSFEYLRWCGDENESINWLHHFLNFTFFRYLILQYRFTRGYQDHSEQFFQSFHESRSEK